VFSIRNDSLHEAIQYKLLRPLELSNKRPTEQCGSVVKLKQFRQRLYIFQIFHETYRQIH